MIDHNENPQFTKDRRQLKLLLALDAARDAQQVESDPDSIFNAIMLLLKSHFEADACAILIQPDDTKTVESLVFSGIDTDEALQLCREAINLHLPGPLSHSGFALGMRIVHDESDSLLGGLLIARHGRPFSDQDTEMLAVAESQIDSAIIQVRTLWQLVQRKTELEAIYHIDRLRDSTTDEMTLINDFSQLLIDYFSTELCIIFVNHIDSGETVLRGVIDRHNLPAGTLETIQAMADTIDNIHEMPLPPLQVMAAPLVVSGVRLGTVVIGRSSAYSISDHSLIHAMVTQMDSALAHIRTIQQLFQRNKELETVYTIDKIRDNETDMDRMLQEVLLVLCQAVSAEIGYLMLFSETDEQTLELRATTSDGLTAAHLQTVQQQSRIALDSGEPVFSNVPDGAVRSIVAIPLTLNDQVIGVFGAVNSRNPRGFNAEDRRMLTAITTQVDTAVFEQLQRRQMRRVLSRSVDPKVIDHLLSRANKDILAGERVTLTVLFADLRDSTIWVEHTPPEQLVSTLNRFLGKMTEVIFAYGGTLDKFVGDECIALFGCPLPMEDHALNAVRCALEMQRVHCELQAELREKGIDLPDVGIGISTGEVIAGEIGSPVRTDFTALGRSINLGARLCKAALGGQILISKQTNQTCRPLIEAEELAPVELKGLGPVQVYQLLRVHE